MNVGHVNARPVVFSSDYGRTFAPVEFGDDQGKAYGFAVGDVDEDGSNDMAMARSGAPNMLNLVDQVLNGNANQTSRASSPTAVSFNGGTSPHDFSNW